MHHVRRVLFVCALFALCAICALGCTRSNPMAPENATSDMALKNAPACEIYDDAAICFLEEDAVEENGKLNLDHPWGEIVIDGQDEPAVFIGNDLPAGNEGTSSIDPGPVVRRVTDAIEFLEEDAVEFP